MPQNIGLMYGGGAKSRSSFQGSFWVGRGNLLSEREDRSWQVNCRLRGHSSCLQILESGCSDCMLGRQSLLWSGKVTAI